MEVVNNNAEQQALTNEQKLQYENTQLKGILDNMRKQMEQMNMVNVFKRLDYLFKVLENKESFSSDFVIACVDEIEGRISLKDEEEEEPEASKEDK